ncbi:MAG: hypothetical protein Kow0056_12220 [Coriobacteriia bacterium]
MKDVSIRIKILVGVLAVVLLGALVVVVYLHQSYSSGLDVAAQQSVGRAVSVWNVLYEEEEMGQLGMDQQTIDLVQRLSEATGDDYALLLSKDALDEEVYEEQRESLGLPGNWDERDEYVLVTSTKEGLLDDLRFETPPTDVPGIGKVVGIENGACTRTCHGGIERSQGDFWGVAWSKDSRSRAHSVFPVGSGETGLVGVIYGIHDISTEADAARQSMLRTLFVIAVTLIVVAVIISAMLDSLVFKRLGRMIVTIEDASVAVAGGMGEFEFDPGDRNDEIGQFEQFFAKFLKLVSSVFASVQKDVE